MYVTESAKKRVFPSAEAFEAFGYCWEQIVTIPDALLNAIPNGSMMNP